MRWLMPMPVLPAITAGTQPPQGVTDTTQPSSSAASIEVVPVGNVLAGRCGRHGRCFGLEARRVGRASASSRSLNGFVPPWNGYGSPGSHVGIVAVAG